MNIIFILTDQQHFRTHHATGCPEARTPNLDRLASEGLNFQQHMVANPVCMPSRGAIWTGRMPSETGLCANGSRFPERPRTFVASLNDAGYHTAHFGKMHLVPCLNRIEPHPAYDFQEFLCGEGDQWLLHDDYNNWFRCNHPTEFLLHYTKMTKAGFDTPHTANIKEEHTHNAWVTRQGLDYLDRNRDSDNPFFLSLGYFDPHHAFNPCEPYASQWAEAKVNEPISNSEQWQKMPSFMQDEFKQDCYKKDPQKILDVRRACHAMMSHIDDCVGRLLSKLEETGQIKDTLIIFSSDHGEFLGNHGRLFKGGFLLDDLIRVPLFVWHGDPAKRRQGQVEAVTSACDFYPTILRLAGMDAEGPKGTEPFLDASLNVHPEGTRGYAISEWRVAPYDSRNDILSIRTRDARLTLYGDSDEGELYRHTEDPYELQNVYAESSHAQLRSELQELLHAGAPPQSRWPAPETIW